MFYERLQLLGILAAGLSIGSLHAKDAATNPLEGAVGRVLTTYFTEYQKLGTPPSGEHILAAIKQGRAQIKALPETERARFYWTILMTINLDASYLSQTQQMIIEDCRDAFFQYAENFLQKHGISEAQASDRAFNFATYKTELSAVGKIRLHYLGLKANFPGR